MKPPFLSCAIFTSLLAGNAYAGTINVDFTKNTGTVNSRAFSMDSTEYGSPHDIVHDQTVYNLIAALHLDAMRIDLQNGNGVAPQLGAGNTSGPGDPWVQAIDKMGAKPIIRLHTIGENDNGADSGGSTADAQAMVSRYTANYASYGLSKPVQYYVIGNETNANDSSGSNFIAFAPGMRSAANGQAIYIGGPAWGWYSEGTMTTYYNHTKGTAGGPDFLDYHQYGNGGNTHMTPTQLQQELNGGGTGGDVQEYGTVSYQAEVAKLHADTGLPIEVGEWNLSWGSDPAQGQPFNAIWGASVIGNIVKAGGISMEYGDSSGSLMGVVSQNDTPMPLYYAYYMFTGGDLFQHFGTNMVLTSVTGDTTGNIQGSNVVKNSTLEVFASNNPKNIVVINKDPNTTQMGTVSLTGYASGTMNAWQTTGNALPTHVAINVAITNGTFTYSVPPYSITTFVLGN